MEKEFWEKRWEDNQIGWDVGDVSAPLKNYIDQLTNREIRILIPGAGNAYEAEYLFLSGFKHVIIIDISAKAIASFLKRLPDFPKSQAIIGDFFEHKGQYDLIIEQTFFCAIDPINRDRYIQKMSELLVPEGKLVGLLFNFPLETGPPFGGDLEEYKIRFNSLLKLKKMEKANNSIKPREGREFFFIAEKR